MHHRICLAANFESTQLGGSWERALQAVGADVVRFDVSAERARLGWLVRNRVAHRLTINSYALRRVTTRAFNRALYDRVVSASADVVILHNGEFVFSDTLARIKRIGVKVVVFHADNPFPPHYNNRPETLAVARETDMYLTWSERLVGKLAFEGVPDVRFLPFAWDSAVFPYDVPPATPWEGVLFVGNWDQRREQFLDRLASQFPLRIYGSGYWGSRTKSRSLARQCWMGRPVTGADAAQAIRGSAICLNILRDQHYIDGKAAGVLMRHFEVPGAGGFLLSTRSVEACRLFPEGEMADYFDDVEEALQKTALYMNNPVLRRAVARRGHDRVAAADTYIHRMNDVLRWLDER